MKLKELLAALEDYKSTGDETRSISGLRYDSRRVAEKDLFFAWRGANSDGHRYISDVISRGASGVVMEDASYIPPGNIPCVIVSDARRALARMGGAFYGNPSRSLKVIGITGTNGKTTTAFIVKHLLESLGTPTGLIGTIRYEIGQRILPASRTTPEGNDLQEYLAQMRDSGLKAVSMEVSSHALAQGRVEGMEFSAAVFTNLTQDHLDYHQTMEAYFEAKSLLFSGLKPGALAVVNIDDTYSAALLERIPEGVKIITVSASGNPRADVSAVGASIHLTGNEFRIRYQGVEHQCKTTLVGRFNIENTLLALGIGLGFGNTLEKLIPLMKDFSGVPGRLEVFRSADGVSVVVDYAHTEDALRKALETLKEARPIRLGVVMGCGGNRDAGKRPKMAKAARDLADWAIFTSDNPRNEKPEEIIKQMETGVSGWKGYSTCVDRGEAIARALSQAQSGDLICVAGKGHETTQEIAGRMIPWDDRALVRDLLAKRGGKS